MSLWSRRGCVDRSAILRPIADQFLFPTSATRLLLVALEFRCSAGLTGLRHTTILGIGGETPSFAVTWLNMTGRVSLHQVPATDSDSKTQICCLFRWGIKFSRDNSRSAEAFIAKVTYVWLLLSIYRELTGCIDNTVYVKRTDVIEHGELGGRLCCIFFRRNRTGNSRPSAWRGSCGENCRDWGAGSHLSWRRYTNVLTKLD